MSQDLSYCPVCLLPLTPTAMSRVDNKTKICRFCAMAEAKDPTMVRTLKEDMSQGGHTDFLCYLESKRYKDG